MVILLRVQAESTKRKRESQRTVNSKRYGGERVNGGEKVSNTNNNRATE